VLDYHFGEILELEQFKGDPLKVWDGLTPLGDLRIPLSYFDKIDLNNISSLTITPNTDKGAIMISDFYLMK
jgi:hypothetical protein